MSSLLTGLVSYYQLEGNANDSLGINNATTTTATYSLSSGKILQGANNTALFSTGFQTGALTGFPAGNSSRTVSAWIRTVSGNVMVFLGYGQDVGPPNEDFVFLIIGGNIYIACGGGGALVNSGINVVDGVYHFVVGTYDGSNLSVYVDNVFAANSPGNSLNTILTTFRMNAYQYDGDVDEIGVWNRVLSGSEINDLWNAGAGLTYPFAPPVSATNAGLLFNLL